MFCSMPQFNLSYISGLGSNFLKKILHMFKCSRSFCADYISPSLTFLKLNGVQVELNDFFCYTREQKQIMIVSLRLYRR